MSVTGTLGIGKSVFYLYFFESSRRENPDKKVLTASFSRERVMEDCVLWKEDGTVEATFTKVPHNPCDYISSMTVHKMLNPLEVQR
jgi:hypothetical protein